MTQQKIGPWEVIKPLGKGGQGQVSLVRRPGRVQERKEAIQEIVAASPWQHNISTQEVTQAVERMASSEATSAC